MAAGCVDAMRGRGRRLALACVLLGLAGPVPAQEAEQDTAPQRDEVIAPLPEAPRPAQDRPLEVTITPPQDAPRPPEPTPDWARVPLGDGTTGSLLDFLDRLPAHDVNFSPSGLFQAFRERMLPPLEPRPEAEKLGEAVDMGLVIGGIYRRMRPDELRLALGVRAAMAGPSITGLGIYSALGPESCPGGLVRCGPDLLGARAPIFEQIAGEK